MSAIELEWRFRTAMKLVAFYDYSLAVPSKLASALALATISRGTLQEHCVRQQPAPKTVRQQPSPMGAVVD